MIFMMLIRLRLDPFAPVLDPSQSTTRRYDILNKGLTRISTKSNPL
jgi:hypothetical protein